MQAHSASGPRPLENENLSSRHGLVTAGAATLVVERMPEAEFIEVSENIELVVGRERQRRG